MPLIRTLDRELKAAAMVGAPRLSAIQPLILGGFLENFPPRIKLWEIPSVCSDGSAPATKATFAQALAFLAHQTRANKEQLDGVQKSFDANGGLSLISGLPNSGKTSLLILQALTAFSCGYKVLLAAPGNGNLVIRNMLGESLPIMPNGKKPKIYLATPAIEERIGFAIFEFTCARQERDENKPHTLVWGILQAIEEDRLTLLSPAYQVKLKTHGKYYPSMQPLVDSVLFMDMLSTISETSSEADKARFHLLYKKLLYRVIATADIIIASCYDAGHEDLYLNFGPTVVIVDNATEASEPETFIPLLMYQCVQIRILLGNRRNICLPIEQPWSPGLVQRQMSFFERMALNGVPVHELKTQYPQAQQTHVRHYSQEVDNKLAATLIDGVKDRVSLHAKTPFDIKLADGIPPSADSAQCLVAPTS
ncbi:hypothetical protein P7C71_g2673, partial [Lecanoromycetidae sp. Uapishka_2]